jgi:FKBP-type peptidyl-prolyl cis-trans isomerase FkpA
MTRTVRALVLLALLAPFPATPAEIALESEDDKAIYILGHAVARQLADYSLTDREFEVMLSGLREGVAGQEPRFKSEDYEKKLTAIFVSRIVTKQKLAGKAYMDKAITEPGAEKSPSGVIMTIKEPGSGASPTTSDRVEVHYVGTLVDGTEFDSSRKRGKPAEFPVTGVIPCWTESLLKLKPGAKAKLVCPPETAYGDRGSGAGIKPGATLVFDVELLRVVK